jgi:hypothetical protein
VLINHFNIHTHITATKAKFFALGRLGPRHCGLHGVECLLLYGTRRRRGHEGPRPLSYDQATPGADAAMAGPCTMAGPRPAFTLQASAAAHALNR